MAEAELSYVKVQYELLSSKKYLEKLVGANVRGIEGQDVVIEEVRGYIQKLEVEAERLSVVVLRKQADLDEYYA